jgi:O-antigen/teichoic acid export membrane protein
LKSGTKHKKKSHSEVIVNPLVKRYGQIFGFTISGKVAAMCSHAAFFWLVNRMIGKTSFGVCILSYTVVSIVAAIIGSPYQKVVLFRVSHAHGLQDEALVNAIVVKALKWGCLTSIVTAFVLYWLASPVSHLFGKSGLSQWLSAFAPLIPLEVAVLILSAAERGRQHLGIWVLVNDVLPYVSRLAVLLICSFFATAFMAVLVSYWTSALIPLAVILLATPYVMKRSASRFTFTKADKLYGLKMALSQVMNRPTKSVDLLLIGSFGTEIMLANYAMASRLVILAATVRQAISNLLVPRLGSLFAKNDRRQLHREYSITRDIAWMASLLVSIGCVVAGPFILGIFGDYKEAFPILLALCGLMMARTIFGDTGGYLQMRGYAGTTLAISFLGLLVFFGVGLNLAPPVDGAHVALLMMMTVLLQKVVIYLAVKVRDNFDLASPIILFCGATGIGAVAMASAVSPARWPSAFALSIILLFFSYCNYRKIKTSGKQIYNLKKTSGTP